MSQSGLRLGDAIKQWLHQILYYNKNDLRTQIRNLIIITLCTAVLTYVLSLGWDRGVTWHVLHILEDLVPGPVGPIHVIPLGFFLGLVSIFWLDAYKRLQGLLLLIPAVLTVFIVGFYVDRFRIPLTPLVVAAGGSAFLIGLLWGGLFERIFQRGNPRMDRGFKRLIAVVGLFGFWGILEATIDYETPIVLSRNNPIEVGGTLIPVTFREITVHGFGNSLETSGGAMLVYFGVLGALLWTLRDFTEYEMDKDVLILGPDRAGKTWLMSGAAFCLKRRAIQDHSFENPNINPALEPYVEIFRQGAFDHDMLEANARDEFDFFSFEYDHGILPRRKLRVRTIDYAGEHLQKVSTDPWDTFNSKWAEDDDKEHVEAGEVPDFRTLRSLDRQGKIDEDDIPSLLSVMIAEYDAIGLTLPADEFADDLDDDDLPDHLSRDTLNDRIFSRGTESHNASGTGYFQIYEDLLNTYTGTDFFFTVTMADTFLESYKNDSEFSTLDPKGTPNWDNFRKHVFGKIKNKNDKNNSVGVDFMSQAVAQDYRHYYPVYFEPLDPPNHLVNGEFKPYLDWEDDYYPLRGLKYLLRRIGR